MQIKGNFTRQQFFKELSREQTEAILLGDFGQADTFQATEDKLKKLKGNDAYEMLKSARKKKAFWESKGPTALVAGSALAILAFSGLVGLAFLPLTSTLNAVASGITAGAIPTQICLGVSLANSLAEESGGAKKGRSQKKASEYAALESVIVTQVNEGLEAPPRLSNPSRVKIQNTLERELEIARGGSDLERVYDAEQELERFERLKGDDFLTLFKKNRKNGGARTLLRSVLELTRQSEADSDKGQLTG